MLQDNASEKIEKMPDLLCVSNLSDFENKKLNETQFDFESELITFNSSTPQLTNFRYKLVSEIILEHPLISRVSVPPQYVFSILNQLMDLQKSPKYSFIKNKLFSAFSLPNDQSAIFLEGPSIDEIIQLFSIFKNAFSITEKDIIQFANVHDIIHNVCNPIKTISFQIGNLIRILTPSHQNQVVQIIDFQPKKSEIVIKFCPKIDYDLLIEKGLNSQAQLNNLMPCDYVPPLNEFQPEKLKSSIPSINIEQKEMKLSWIENPVIFDFWDESLFLGPLQCEKINISHLNLLSLDLKKEEIELFKQGLTEFEKENETFIRNFQMSYDSSYETSETDYNLIDTNEDFLLDQIEWTKSPEDNQKSLKEEPNSSISSLAENNPKSHKVHIEIPINSNVDSLNKDRIKSQAKRPHSPVDKKVTEQLKVGDIVISRTPLENIALKVREVDNQRIVKADALDVPIIGRMNQFTKIPPNSLFRFGKTAYETQQNVSPQSPSSSSSVKEIPNRANNSNQIEFKSAWENPSVGIQCDMIVEYRMGDIIETKDNKVCIIISIEEGNVFRVIDLDNSKHSIKYWDIDHMVPGDINGVDCNGNKIFSHNIVYTKDGDIGEIIALYQNKVFLDLIYSENEDACFHDQMNVKLDTSDMRVPNNSMCNNYNDGYGNNNNYDGNYNNGFNNNYNYQSNNRNISGSSSNSRFSQNGDYDNGNNYNSYNDPIRNQFNGNNNRGMPQPNRSAPPLQTKSSGEMEKLPIWVCEKSMVVVAGRKEDGVISSVQKGQISVQFLDSKTNRLKFASSVFPLKDLTPMPFYVGDTVMLYDRGDKFIGKVYKKTNHHVYIDISKKKKSRMDKIEGLIKDAFRIYDWESLDDI